MLKENIQIFNHSYPQEKIYLHFDNTGYFLGENIWFKAYVIMADNHKPSSLNRVLYTELLESGCKIRPIRQNRSAIFQQQFRQKMIIKAEGLTKTGVPVILNQ